jgi:hypothetical protein
MSELCTADTSTGFRAPSTECWIRGTICADRDANRICGVSSATREQLAEERAIATQKREVPKRLRCHRFEVGPTVRIHFAPAGSHVRTDFSLCGGCPVMLLLRPSLSSQEPPRHGPRRGGPAKWCGVLPQNVGLAVVVVVAGPENMPVRPRIAETGGAPPRSPPRRCRSAT